MSNTIEIVVEGKNEATKVFSEVEQSAGKSGRAAAQSWTKSMDDIEQSTKSTSTSVDRSSESLGKFGDTARKSSKDTKDLGDKSKETSDRLSRIGETSDEVDTKAMGFRDTVTGVSDTLRGLNDTSLNTEQRLLYLGMGIGDLGSAGYNLLVPAMSKAKQVITDLGNPTSALREKLSGLGKSMLGLTAGAAVIVGAGMALDAAFGGPVKVNVDKLTRSLVEFEQTGKISGEASRVFSGNLETLGTAFRSVTAGGVVKFAESILDAVPGTEILGVSSDKAKERIAGLDASLTKMAQTSPQQARDAFNDLARKMGLTADETKKLEGQLPGFTSELQKADDATLNTAVSTERNAAALANYLTQLSAATDPVFNLMTSLNQVKDAQTAYTDAVKEHGLKSNEAKDASVALAEAVAGAEAAALNGNLSYSDFSATLDHWVQSGVVTAQQARDIRGRVDEARGAAQSYAGNYDANLYVNNHASEVIARVKADLASIPKNGATNWVVNYVQHITGQSPPSMAPGGILPLGRNAHGGPIGHAATGGARGGTTWVGENGPELVNLPVGSFVNPAGASSQNGMVKYGSVSQQKWDELYASGWRGNPNDSMEALYAPSIGGSGSAGSSPGRLPSARSAQRSDAVKVYIDISGGDQALMQWLRGAIRVEGGDVQTVLGRG